jgi:hypothetical protein
MSIDLCCGSLEKDNHLCDVVLKEIFATNYSVYLNSINQWSLKNTFSF